MAKPEIYAKEILSDVRSGMDDVNLMHKYKVTVKGLDSVFRKLLAAGVISQQELNTCKIGYLETVNLSGLFTVQEQGSGLIPQKEENGVLVFGNGGRHRYSGLYPMDIA
ncbi:MAG: hypothetical protein ACLQPD_30205 [Desulfomonilaceae bacterium]